MGIQHLLQNCRDQIHLSFEESAAYLRQNSLIYECLKAARTPTRLLRVEESPSTQVTAKYGTTEQVSQAFHDMASKEGVGPAYKIFAMKGYSKSLSITDKIWAELEPLIKEKITAIRAKL